jgi:LysM repeat protein
MIYHKVRRGENLSSIAHRYGTSVSALVAANHLRNRNNLRVGQRLLVPTSKYYSTPEKITAETNLIIHVVKSGETLSEIAESYHTSLSKIRSLNNIYQDNIKVGMKLKIPTNLTSQKTPSDTPKGSEKVVHIVKRGETLTSIANRYHVSLVKVKSWNDLDGRKPIYPGQRIIIYKSIQG